MKRKPVLTKRERKALDPRPNSTGAHSHIHCIACGAHLEPDTVRYVACRHGTRYPSCAGCITETKRRLQEHDLYQRPVERAPAWHDHHGHS